MSSWKPWLIAWVFWNYFTPFEFIFLLQHWTSISALSRRALLDDARLIVILKTQLPLNEIYTEFHQNVQRATDRLCQQLRTEANITISAHSMKMIFGFESAGRARGIASQTVREKGNAAAHEVDQGDVLHSVLQEDLTEPQRTSLEEIYTIVCGHPPTFVVWKIPFMSWDHFILSIIGSHPMFNT